MHDSGTLTGVKHTVRRGGMQVAAMMVVLVALAAAYTIAGVGMDTSALEMTFGGKMGESGGMAGMVMDSPGSREGTKV